MVRLFFILLFVIFFKLSVAIAETRCSNLFHSAETITSPTLEKVLEEKLLDKNFLKEVYNLRKKIQFGVERDITLSTFASVLEPAAQIGFSPGLSRGEKLAVTLGIGKILDDLSEISPKYVSTERIMNENIALIMAQIKKESVEDISSDENVVSISGDKYGIDIGYRAARKKIFELIDSYWGQRNIPNRVKIDRIEDLLSADVRFRELEVFEQDQILEQIVYDKPYHGVERILEQFFKRKEKSS